VAEARRRLAVAGTLLGAASALAACDGSYDQPADRHWPSAHYALPAGSYFLDYEEVSGAEGTVAGTADFSPPLAPTCAAANAAAVDAADVTLTIPSSQPNWFWPLPPPPSPGQMLSVFPPFDVLATAAICASCDPTSCVDASQAVPWASGQMLNFETNSSEPFNRFILNWSY
jgi:hypothetical protein